MEETLPTSVHKEDVQPKGQGKKLLYSLVALLLVLCILAGLGTYYWQQNKVAAEQLKVTRLNQQITVLNKKVTDLTARLATPVLTPAPTASLAVKVTKAEYFHDADAHVPENALFTTLSFTNNSSKVYAFSLNDLSISTKVGGSTLPKTISYPDRFEYVSNILRDQNVAPGKTITGWIASSLTGQDYDATDFSILFVDNTNQATQTVDYTATLNSTKQKY